MNGNADGSKTIQAADTALDVIEAVRNLNGATITELASHLERSKSTIHGHVTTLRTRGYLVKQDDGSYHVGLLFLGLGNKARKKYGYLSDIQPKIERLAVETSERVQYMIEENDRGIYVFRATGEKAPPTDARVGRPRELHACAAGKSILAHLLDDRVESIINREGLVKKTENTITDPAVLHEQLATIRERGFAINDNESVEGVWAIGAPVTDDDGSILGGLSISGPAHRMENHENYIENYANQLIGTVEEIELNITYS